MRSLSKGTLATIKAKHMPSKALYLESITLGQAWLSSNDGVRPRFSTYDIEDADVP
ncbi:hypothetical protein AHAS_Ahas13G0332600 [Arachis hypogaea]